MTAAAETSVAALAPFAAATDEDGVFSVVIPAPRRRRLLVLLLLWALAWAFATAHALVRLFTPVHTGEDPHWFRLYWLALWLFSLPAIDALLYMLSGREVVSVEGGLLSITCEAPFYVMTRRFDLSHVGRLRAGPVIPVDRVLIGHRDIGRIAGSLGLTGNQVVFDYDFLTHHFGNGLEAEAAERLAAEILARFPSLGAARPYEGI